MLGKKYPGIRTGRPTGLSADGSPEWLDHGATLGWEAIDPVNTLTVLSDGTQVHPGERYLEVGTVLVKASKGTTQTIKIEDATGGTFDIVPSTGGPVAGIPHDASADDLKELLKVNPIFDGATVTLSTGTYTIVFSPSKGKVAELKTVNNLTSDTAATITVAVTVPGEEYSGKWIPYDSAGTKGNDALTRGEVGLVDHTVKDKETRALGTTTEAELIGLITGGLVWRERLKVGGSGQASLGDLLDVLPRLEITQPE